jgi:hypothetical protein
VIFPTFALVLRSGQLVDFAHPDLIVLEADLVHGLSRSRRYAGVVDITVLEHLALCVRLAAIMFPGNRAVAAYVAAHDLHETYFPDIPRPLKMLLPEYARMEKHWEAHVHLQLGLLWPLNEVVHDHVHEIDFRAPAVEPTVWGHPHGDHYAHHHGGVPTESELAAAETVRWATPDENWQLVRDAIVVYLGRDPFERGQAA